MEIRGNKSVRWEMWKTLRGRERLLGRCWALLVSGSVVQIGQGASTQVEFHATYFLFWNPLLKETLCLTVAEPERNTGTPAHRKAQHWFPGL